MNITNNQSSTRLPVETETMAAWKKFYQVGDIVQISKQYDLSISTVGIALKGLASKITVDKINDYYGITSVASQQKDEKKTRKKK